MYWNPVHTSNPIEYLSLWERSLIKSIVTKGNSQYLASLVHLQCTPVSWDSANNVSMLYLISFRYVECFPLDNKGNEDIR